MFGECLVLGDWDWVLLFAWRGVGSYIPLGWIVRRSVGLSWCMIPRFCLWLCIFLPLSTLLLDPIFHRPGRVLQKQKACKTIKPRHFADVRLSHWVNVNISYLSALHSSFLPRNAQCAVQYRHVSTTRHAARKSRVHHGQHNSSRPHPSDTAPITPSPSPASTPTPLTPPSPYPTPRRSPKNRLRSQNRPRPRSLRLPPRRPHRAPQSPRLRLHQHRRRARPAEAAGAG